MGVAEIVSIHCWQHGSDLYQLKSDWVTHLSVCVKHGISGFKMWWGFFVFVPHFAAFRVLLCQTTAISVLVYQVFTDLC